MHTSTGLLIPRRKGGFIREEISGRNIACAIHGNPRVGLHSKVYLVYWVCSGFTKWLVLLYITSMPAYSQSYMKVFMAPCWEAAKEPATSQVEQREQRELPGKMHSPVSTQTNSVNISLLFILIGVTEMEAVCIYGPKSRYELLIGACLLCISFPSLSSTRASWNNFLINFLQMASSPRLSLRSPSWTINCQNISFLDVSNVCMFHRQSTRQSLKHSHMVRDFCVII